MSLKCWEGLRGRKSRTMWYFDVGISWKYVFFHLIAFRGVEMVWGIESFFFWSSSLIVSAFFVMITDLSLEEGFSCLENYEICSYNMHSWCSKWAKICTFYAKICNINIRVALIFKFWFFLLPPSKLVLVWKNNSIFFIFPSIEF